jgi:hypothetical protein
MVCAMVLYTDALLLSSMIAASLAGHELLHYITARMLGYDARIVFSRLGYGVRIPVFNDYDRITKIADKSMRRDYLLIGLAPYALVPLYLLAFLFSSSFVIKMGFAVILLYHLPSVLIEFYQDTRSFYIVAGLFNLLLFGFYLVALK